MASQVRTRRRCTAAAGPGAALLLGAVDEVPADAAQAGAEASTAAAATVTNLAHNDNRDGRTDRGIWRPGEGGWYVRNQATVFLGLRGDIPLPLPHAIYRSFTF